MKMNGAELLIKILEKFGVSYIAGIPGGANLPIYDALRNSSITHILARHEQAAGFIAQGISRVGRGPGVCMATSGPGATNLLTALADANLDSIPLVAITGQVSSHLIGTNAFQEVDICSMAKPVVKKTFQVQNISELPETLLNAFQIAICGRRGPVLVDIPRDIQTEFIDIDAAELFFIKPDFSKTGLAETKTVQSDMHKSIPEIIAMSLRPVIYIGGGIIHSGAEHELREYVSRFKIPAVSSLMGLGALEYDNKYFLGMLGMHGTITANLSMEESDLIIAIGARFDDRATGNFERFCPQAKLIHIDIEAKGFHKSRIIDYPWRIDARDALRILLEETPFTDRSRWLDQINMIKLKSTSHDGFAESAGAASSIIRAVAEYSDRKDIIVTDVGQHQMWVAQNFPFTHGGTFLTSGGLGTMGFGLPAAMGAALAFPEKRSFVLPVTGLS